MAEETSNLGIPEFVDKLVKGVKEQQGEKKTQKLQPQGGKKKEKAVTTPTEADKAALEKAIEKGEPWIKAVTSSIETSDEAIIDYLKMLGPNLGYGDVETAVLHKFPLLHAGDYLTGLIDTHYKPPVFIPAEGVIEAATEIETAEGWFKYVIKTAEAKSEETDDHFLADLAQMVDLAWESKYKDKEKPLIALEPKAGSFYAHLLTKESVEELNNLLYPVAIIPAHEHSMFENITTGLKPHGSIKNNISDINQKVTLLEKLMNTVIEKLASQEAKAKYWDAVNTAHPSIPSLSIPSLAQEVIDNAIFKKLTMKKAPAKIEYYRISGKKHKYKYAKGILMHFGQSWSGDPEHKLAVWAAKNPEQADTVWVKLKGNKVVVKLSEVITKLVKELGG